MAQPQALSDLPRFTSQDWLATLVALCESYRQQPHDTAFPFFIQIGAMDGKSFDPIYPLIANSGLPGLLVEPLPDHFSRLLDNYRDVPGLIFEQAAITDFDGTITMHRISDAAVVSGAVPDWMGGIATTMPARGIIGGDHPKAADYQHWVDENLEQIEVPSLSLPSLLAKHRVARTAVLLLDVEGAEWQILQQVDLAQLQPSLAYIEHKNMSPAEITAVLQKFGAAGYAAYRGDEDLLFVKA